MIGTKKRVGIFMKLFRNEPSMHKAIESVLKQTYSYFRLYILVNSNTKDAVYQYAKSDDRIEVIEAKEGKGSILDYDKYIAANGNDYFTVIDGDDWYEENYIQELISFAEKHNTDITACGNYFVNDSGVRVGERRQADICWKSEETGYILSYMYGLFRTIWGKLIKSEVIMKYKPEEYPPQELCGGYGTDTIYMFCILTKAQKVGICNKCLYNYRMSPTGGTYVCHEGRLDSDTFLFDYVKTILEQFGKIPENSINFLYVVYAEALTDTTKLLLNQKIASDELAAKLLYIYNNKRTVEMFEKERNGELSNQSRDYYAKRLYYMVFNKTLEKTNIDSVAEIYLKIFEIIFGTKETKFSIKDFKIFLKDIELLNLQVEKRYNIVFDILLEKVENRHIRLKDCFEILCKTKSSIALEPVLSDEEFVITYSQLLSTINNSEQGKAFKMFQKIFEAEKMPEDAEKLVQLWSNYAAEVEDATEYIIAREYEIEVLFNAGKKEQAKKNYKELEELGINDENMNNLYSYLYKV